MNQIQRRLFLGGIFASPLVLAQSRRDNRDGITATVNDCERLTNSFIGSLRRALNEANVRYDRKDDLLRSARDLENAMDQVGKAWNRDHNPAGAGQSVRAAIDSAQQINGIMLRRRLNLNTEREWAQVRRELNRLAKAFNTPGLRT